MEVCGRIREVKEATKLVAVGEIPLYSLAGIIVGGVVIEVLIIEEVK
jgi:hypothetical protein